MSHTFDQATPSLHELAGGARLATLPLPRAQSVSLGAWLRSGTRDEPTGIGGIAHLLEHMVFKGTRDHDVYSLARAFETLGGTMDAYTTHEATVYSLLVLPEHVGAALDLLSQILVHARLDAADLALEKQVVGEEIEESEDNPSDIVAELCATQAWGDHPLARPVLGTSASLAAIDHATLLDWRRTQYAGDRLLLAAAGAVDPEALAQQAEGALAGWPTPSASQQRTAPGFRPGLAVRREPGDQVHLCLAVSAPAAADPQQHALWVVDMLLGATMSSRLFQEVREKRGLAYNISSSWQAQADAGLLTIDAVASPAKVAELVAVVREQTWDLAARPLSEVDLAWVKDYARTTLRLGSGSVPGQMARLARGWITEGRAVSLAETLAAIEALTPADTQAVAERLFGAGGQAWAGAAVGAVTPKRADRWTEVLTS